MLKTERLHLRLTPDERRALDALAAERERTRSALLRELVLQEARHSPRATVDNTEAERASKRQEVGAIA